MAPPVTRRRLASGAASLFLTPALTAAIDFHGATLIARPGDQPATTLVAMKPIVEGMGLDWPAQHRRLKDHAVLAPTMAEMLMVAEDGKLRAMTALPLNRLHFWMATIQPNKVTDRAVRARVIAYQTECADALFEHFFGQRGINSNDIPADPPPASLARKPYDEWSLDERRTAISEVNGARHTLNQASAAWLWGRIGLPVPPRHLLPAWWQADMAFHQPGDGRSVTIIVPQNGGQH